MRRLSLSVTHVLWLNRTSLGIGDNTVRYGDDEFLQAVNSNHVICLCSGLAAILNANLLPAAITHVR